MRIDDLLVTDCESKRVKDLEAALLQAIKELEHITLWGVETYDPSVLTELRKIYEHRDR